MTIPKDASFSPEDNCYPCPNCFNVTLRYNAGIARPVQVSSCDSSAESVISWDRHVCMSATKHVHIPQEIGLQSQRAERTSQEEVYGSGIFESTAQFQSKPNYKTIASLRKEGANK
jgi:hypothetical protein